MRDAVSQELKKLVELDVIEPIDSSECVSPIVVIIKKNGGFCLCEDLIEPIRADVIDGYPLPHMEEMFTELQGGTLLSTMDLQSVHHQVVLH